MLSQSEWETPVVLVPIPDRSLSFCVDYRKHNAITKKKCYQTLLIDICIKFSGDSPRFTTPDASSGTERLT